MDNQNEIARIAYELFLMRGGAPGDPIADWLTAERIFEEKQKSLMIRTLEEPVMVVEENPVTVEAPVAKKARKAAPKAEVKEAAPKKEARKAAAPKAVAAKVEKAVEAPKPKPVSRKKPAVQ